MSKELHETEYQATLTVDELIGKVREVAARTPDHVYAGPVIAIQHGQEIRGSCTYVHEEFDAGAGGESAILTPGCLLGVALIELGVPMEFLNRRCPNSGISRVLRILGVLPHGVDSWDTETYRKVEWLAMVQSSQDAGWPWGTCVERADRNCPLNKP